MSLIVTMPTVLAWSTSAESAEYTPSTETFILNKLIPFLNATNFLLDGPASVSYAPTTPTTNLEPTLKQMMYYNYYCASMYCQYEINDLSCDYCQMFEEDVVKWKVLMNNDTLVTALVTLSPEREEIVVAFRGSQNPWNFVLDFTMLSVCYDVPNCNIKLHVGFYIFTMSLYSEVIANIGYLLSTNPSYKIVLTGHSLGGAMARITTFFILYRKQFPADFAPHIMPVSILGTAALGDYYIHPQPEYWINGTDNQRFANTSLYNDPTRSDSMGPAYSVLDHFQYFDADYLVCWLDQPLVWLALPASILQPVGVIPPLPPKISNFASAALNFVSGLLGGILG